MKVKDKIITVDYHKTKKELIVHYRNAHGQKKVRRTKLMLYPLYVPIDRMKEFRKVCGDLIEYEGQKTFYSYDRKLELVKVEMNAQYWMDKKRESTRTRIIKKFDLQQADINPVQLHAVENKLLWEKDVRHCYFDIETNGGLKVEGPEEEITSLCFYLKKVDKYYVFSWHPSMDKVAVVKQKNETYIVCNREEIMLKYFIKWLRDNFNLIDSLIGWNSSNFDIPYIINRLDRLGFNRMTVSPLAKYAWTFAPRGMRYNKISGVNLIDYMELYKKQVRKISPPNWKLDTIAEFEDLGIKKESEYTWRDWMSHFKGFLGYQVRDVELLVELEKKLQYVSFLSVFQDIVKLPLEMLI